MEEKKAVNPEKILCRLVTINGFPKKSKNIRISVNSTLNS